MTNDKTLIQVDKTTAEELSRFKVHPRETYNDVIKRFIRFITKGELEPSKEGDASNSKKEEKKDD